jgi:hypothetical protein
MHRSTAIATAFFVALVACSWPAFGQNKPACQQGRVVTPQKVEGEVVKVDAARNKLSVREADGKVHEFEASKETLQEFKVGDRIEANLREAPKCP